MLVWFFTNPRRGSRLLFKARLNIIIVKRNVYRGVCIDIITRAVTCTAPSVYVWVFNQCAEKEQRENGKIYAPKLMIAKFIKACLFNTLHRVFFPCSSSVHQKQRKYCRCWYVLFVNRFTWLSDNWISPEALLLSKFRWHLRRCIVNPVIKYETRSFSFIIGISHYIWRPASYLSIVFNR